MDACKYVQNERLDEEIGAKQAGCEGQRREKDHVRGDKADVERKRLRRFRDSQRDSGDEKVQRPKTNTNMYDLWNEAR